MSMINIIDLTFGYDGLNNVFEKISFQIDSDWKLGLVGRNGRGKTTFLKILQGELEYKGNINHIVNFDYFPYEVENENQFTINILYEINPLLEEWQLKKELNFLEVKEDVLYRNYNTLSKGEQTKILLACLFLKKNNFLLIDEPTNHLDYLGKKIVANYLNSKKGFILVSHDRIFIDKCVNYILSINKNNIEVQRGNFSSYMGNKENQDNLELKTNEKLKKEISVLEESRKRTKQWSDSVERSKFGDGHVDKGYIGHKAAKMMKRSKVLEKRVDKSLEEKSKLLKNIENYEEININTIPFHKDILIQVKDVSLNYNNKNILKNINFNIIQGDKIAIVGKNGSGKSTLLKIILGEEKNYSGEIIIPENLKISYIPQDTSFLNGTIEDFVTENNLDISIFKAILRKLDFERFHFKRNLEDYSAGQKKKILIAKSLSDLGNIFIWDEPLNYIDVFSRIQIEESILKFNPTMIFVEHDETFIKKIATKFININ